jgi:2,3-bisphosphoglycerate-independent phosphoglycerate mutase
MSLPSVALVILDGWGLAPPGPGNAISQAETPVFDRLWSTYPHTELSAQGRDVGLPDGQMGNSEVGHLNLGAGAIVKQDLARIDDAIADGSFFDNEALRAACECARRSPRGRLHLLGLVSDGGVHSGWEHIEATIELASQEGVPDVVFHAFTDGRDTLPHGGHEYLAELERWLRQAGRVATVGGRYYAMDRDSRWDRIARAYNAIVCREGEAAPDALSAIETSYARNETDEFVRPAVVAGGRALSDGDGVFFFNFRADRARELTNALTGARPDRFAGELERRKVVDLAGFLCMTEYDAAFGLAVAFPPETPRKLLGEIVSAAGLSQLRMAETEKYAHVTFFFNSGVEEPFPDEERVLIPSPRDVATYDHRPEMSALQVTEALTARLEKGDYAFVLVNYANPDMVGHTGVMDAAVKAVETIDHCLERVSEVVLERGGQMLITADHGNCELMVDPETGEPHTAHTTNPVPIYWIIRDARGRSLRDGTLADLAPTVLDLLGLEAPEEMTGRSLIVPADA